MATGRRRTPIERVLRRRRIYTGGGWIILLLLASLAVADRMGWLGSRGGDWDQFDRQSFVVSDVVDGDTIHVRSGPAGDATKVRLIGVDAPELRPNENRPPDHWADRAARYLEARCEGRTITLRLEQTQTRDRYGRLLAYAYISDSDLLNLDLIRDGQAYADRRFKHTFRPQFELAETEARRKQRGLWKDVTEEQMPEWRRVWLRELRETR
jgi:micrococcal nuclease